MVDLKNTFQIFKKKYFPIVGVLLLILLAGLLLWFNNSKSLQAESATVAKVYFDGEYRVGDGEWQPITVGKHIPTTKGDVTMRINFHLMDPDGNPMDDMERTVPVAFYTDHIGLTICEVGREPYRLSILCRRQTDPCDRQ